VIVLNWNGLADTLECIHSLLPQVNSGRLLYVVDNGSTDQSVLELRRLFADRIVLLANPRNLLYAGGNNVGILRALADGCSHLLLLNNDTTVAEDFLTELERAANDLGDVILCPKIYYANPADQLWYAGGEMRLRRARIWHRGIRETDHGQYNRREATGWATGCALFGSAQVFKTVGLLDTDFPLYMEDVDYCLRAKQAGFPIYYVPAARVWHKISASVGGNLSRNKLTRKWKSLRLLLNKHVPNPALRVPALADFVVTEFARAGWGILSGKIK
jgi:GT2 family glycosyltransferase